MKALLTILSLLSGILCSQAQIQAAFGTGATQGAPIRKPTYHQHPITPLLYEDFENPAGYDLPSWSGEAVSPGTVNPDNTTNVLYGSQSLAINESHDDPVYVTNSFSPMGHVWVAFRFKLLKVDASAVSTFFHLDDDVGTCQLRLAFNGDRELQVLPACANPTSSAGGLIPLEFNTTYYFWIEYQKDDGANSFTSVAYSTGPGRPTEIDGGYLAYIYGNQSGTDVSQIMFGRKDTDNGQEVDFIIDHVLVDDVQIESYP